MKPGMISWVMLGWATLAAARTESLPAELPRVELEKYTINHNFDLTYTLKGQRVDTATVSLVGQKLEQAGLRVGDELLKVNGKTIRGLKVADFQRRLRAEGIVVYTIRQKHPESGKYRTRELIVTFGAKAPKSAVEQE